MDFDTAYTAIQSLITECAGDSDRFAERLRAGRIPHLSFSQVSTVEACPDRYYLQFVRARSINEEMKLAASHALADLAKEPVTDGVLRAYQLDHLEFGRDYVVPKPFDKRVCLWEAPAVALAAIRSGAARITNLDVEAYKQALSKRLQK